MFSAHALREWAWPHAHMNVTTSTQFAQNCNIGSLVVLYDSTVHVALYPGTIPCFAVLHTEKLAFQCVTLLSWDKVAVQCGDFRIIFFFPA